MSDLLEQPAPPSPKDAKARAKAEKAYSKAVRPWYKKPLIVVPLAIVVLAIFGSLGDDAETGGGTPAPVADVAGPAVADEPAPAEEQDAAPAEAEPAADAPAPADEDLAGVGDAVADGKFTFTVHSFKCGRESVGSDFMEEKAQGQFCLMDLTVANHGDESQYLFSDNQYVFDTKGRKFSHDDMAAITLDDNDVWMEEINPGNKVRGTMVFDVPKNAKIVTAELHDSAFSGGVTLSLK